MVPALRVIFISSLAAAEASADTCGSAAASTCEADAEALVQTKLQSVSAHAHADGGTAARRSSKLGGLLGSKGGKCGLYNCNTSKIKFCTYSETFKAAYAYLENVVPSKSALEMQCNTAGKYWTRWTTLRKLGEDEMGIPETVQTPGSDHIAAHEKQTTDGECTMDRVVKTACNYCDVAATIADVGPGIGLVRNYSVVQKGEGYAFEIECDGDRAPSSDPGVVDLTNDWPMCKTKCEKKTHECMWNDMQHSNCLYLPTTPLKFYNVNCRNYGMFWTRNMTVQLGNPENEDAAPANAAPALLQMGRNGSSAELPMVCSEYEMMKTGCHLCDAAATQNTFNPAVGPRFDYPFLVDAPGCADGEVRYICG